MSAALSPSPAAEPALATEFAFSLPHGYVDGQGELHRDGVMRLATARDEILPLRDHRVRDNPAYLGVLLLSRVVVRLGGLPDVTPGVVEGLFARDLAYLQDLYRRVNLEGATEVNVRCPNCRHEHAVDVAGDAPGGSS